MVNIKIHYICDLCGDEMYVEDNENIPKWATKTEVGDLCPKCMQLWKRYKEDFIKEHIIRKEKDNGR